MFTLTIAIFYIKSIFYILLKTVFLVDFLLFFRHFNAIKTKKSRFTKGSKAKKWWFSAFLLVFLLFLSTKVYKMCFLLLDNWNTMMKKLKEKHKWLLEHKSVSQYQTVKSPRNVFFYQCKYLYYNTHLNTHQTAI